MEHKWGKPFYHFPELENFRGEGASRKVVTFSSCPFPRFLFTYFSPFFSLSSIWLSGPLLSSLSSNNTTTRKELYMAIFKWQCYNTFKLWHLAHFRGLAQRTTNSLCSMFRGTQRRSPPKYIENYFQAIQSTFRSLKCIPRSAIKFVSVWPS